MESCSFLLSASSLEIPGRIWAADQNSDSAPKSSLLPTVHRPIQFAIDRQVCPAIRIFGRKHFIDIHAQARGIARMHHSVRKSVGMRKHAVRLLRVAHEFLDPEIMDAQ